MEPENANVTRSTGTITARDGSVTVRTTAWADGTYTLEADMDAMEPEIDEPTRCVVCGKELPDDAAAVAHLSEALDVERIAARRRATSPIRGDRGEPRRIQRKRTRGWRMPRGAVYVGRPSRWGNPWRAGSVGGPRSAEEAVRTFRLLAETWPTDRLAPLRGRDLVCWCPLDAPCHADVLLDLATSRGDRG